MACDGLCNCLLEILRSPPKWVIDCVTNFRTPQAGVRDLNNALVKLSSSKNSLLNRIGKPEGARDASMSEVTGRLAEVESYVQEVNKIIEENCCFQFFFFNCCLSQLLRGVDKLAAQELEAAASRPPSGAIQEIAVRSTLFGLEPYLEKVDGYLADDAVHMVGIWGMAGVGKTTLLQTIKNELLPGGRLSERNMFDHVLLVVASRYDKLETLQESITKELRCGLEGVRTLDLRAAAISKFLERKKFLLLLDDLWQSVDLKKMGIPIDNPENKVIFTTRSQRVCSRMNPVRTIKMERLDSENAQALFRHNIGKEAVSKSRFDGLSEIVISKCGGLPLALVTIAQALKTDGSDWSLSIAKLRQSRLDEILDEDDRQSFVELYKTLKISYDGLRDDTARKCFLSCALWPEGCPIEKLELIHSWMGLGLLDDAMNHHFDEAYNKGNRVIENLKAAFLLERDVASESKVTMHGVIRDMALWIANEKKATMKNWIVKQDSGIVIVLDDPKCWKAALQISFISHGLTEPPSTVDCRRLSSLMLQNNPKLKNIPGDFFQLKVALSFLDLSFTGLEQLPEVIGSLTQLHYLNLSNTPISSLPSSLKNLKELKYLLLNNTGNLKEIEYGLISSLSMLLVLDLFGCRYAEWTVDDCCSGGASLGEFNKLEQGLKFLGVTIATSEALDQLSRIPRLSTQHLGIIEWAGETSLEKLMDSLSRPTIHQNLKRLKVENCGCSKVLTIGDDNGSWQLPKLEVLELRNLIKLRKITWKPVNARKCLPMICELIISDCDTLEDVSWVLELQHLERLELSNCKFMNKVIKNDPGKQIICDDHRIEVGDEEVMKRPFCGLKMLILKKLTALRRICDHAYDFLALEYLEVQDCEKLRQLPFSSKIIKNKSLAIHGEDKWWNKLVWKDEVGNIKDDLRFRKIKGR